LTKLNCTKAVPFVGPAMTVGMVGYQAVTTLTNDQLSAQEKAGDLLRAAVQTAAGIGGAYGGATLGAEIGVAGGPVGVVVGGFIGALVGGIATSLISRGIERSPLSLIVYHSGDERSPKCILKDLFDKAEYVYIVGTYDTQYIGWFSGRQ